MSDIRVEQGPKGPTVAIQTPDGRWVRLHSSRDPQAEADRLVDGWFADGEPAVLILIGLGLGYVLDAIERRSERTRVLAFEPCVETLAPMRARRDWTPWSAAGRLTLLEGPDFDANPAASAFLGEHPAPIVAHPVIARELPDAVARARAVAEKLLAGAQANATARRQFAGRYLRNTLINVPTIVREADAGRLAGIASGIPTIVVAAGPSLDDNLDDLGRLAGRALIVCVDTALRPLLAAGIRPHLVVGVDPSETNARHLLNPPPVDDVWFVAEGSLDPRVFPSFAGRTFTFKVSNHHPWPWLADHDVARATLRAWGSVLTTAFDLACTMDGDPIVFAGADLAHTKGLLYCRNTAYESDWSHLRTDADRVAEYRDHLSRVGLPVTDLLGGTVVSRPHFVQFRDWIVARAAELAGRAVVNGTGAGILFGPSIAQAALGDLQLPERESVDALIRTRIADAWSEGADERRSIGRAMATSVEGGAELGIPVESWLDFAANADLEPQLSSCVRGAARRLHEPGDSASAAIPTETSGAAVPHGLAVGSRVLVLGTGPSSKALKRRLVGTRSDVHVMGFIDDDENTMKTLDRLPVDSRDRLLAVDYDAVIAPAGETVPPAVASVIGTSAAPVLTCEPGFSAVDTRAPYLWIDEALPRIEIDRPVLLLGKGPGLSKVPYDANRTHFVVSVNQAFARVERADAVFLLDADQLVHILFGPGNWNRWRFLFLPDGIMKQFSNVKDDRVPFGPPEFAGTEPIFTQAWGWDRELPFEVVDRIIDFSWIKDKVVRFALENVYWDPNVHTEWPGIDAEFEAFRPERMTDPLVLKSGCNSAHLALSFLFRKGVTEILTAGLGLEEGYAKDIDAKVTTYARQTRDETPRWLGTLNVMRRLGIRHRRVEDMTDDEVRRVFDAREDG